MDRKPRKVKVYGVDSTKAVRARLIEILMERARYHKDKFVAPVLHHEMQSMEVKKNGKVEHSDRSHDDQVFSYLMAMYVWYDGHNLVENFGIRKNTIHTDEDEELYEPEYEDAIEKREKVDYRSSILETNEEIANELEWIEKSINSYMDSDKLYETEYIKNMKLRNNILNSNKQISDKMEVETGINPILFNVIDRPGYQTIPESVFIDELSEEDMNFDNDDPFATNMNQYRSPLKGNLSSLYDLV